MSAKSTGTLIAGLFLIAAGALFLLVNLSIFNINWVIALETIFPALFIYFGFIKLYRHYTWDREKILQRPAKAGLLGGLFWFSLGVILLLDILDILKTLEVIGTYWPVILILFGLLKILDYYRFGGALQVRTGEVFGVVSLIFFGIGAHQLAKAHFALFDEFHLGGFKWPVMVPGDEQKYQFESEKTVELSDVEMIEVANLYGDLKVFPNGDDSLEIQLSKTIRGETEKDAQSIADSVAIITRPEGKTLRVQTNLQALQERRRK
jgi:hypothetical protein